MPYRSNAELPYWVYNALPTNGQNIYRRTFNQAFEYYGDEDETILHRIAWAAVKRKYHKTGKGPGRTWVEKPKSDKDLDLYYHTVLDLPETVRRHLPLSAQNIFLKAFNNVWKQYTVEETFYSDSRAAAYQTAWHAVKNWYHKVNGRWTRKRGR